MILSGVHIQHRHGDILQIHCLCTDADLALADENVYVRCFGYELATKRFSEVMWAMQQILFMGVDRRLAIFLTEELQKSGGDTVRLTHEQIARYMGSAREVVPAAACLGLEELVREPGPQRMVADRIPEHPP